MTHRCGCQRAHGCVARTCTPHTTVCRVIGVVSAGEVVVVILGLVEPLLNGGVIPNTYLNTFMFGKGLYHAEPNVYTAVGHNSSNSIIQFNSLNE